MPGSIWGAVWMELLDCTPMQPRLRSLGLGLQLRVDGEGAVAFAAGTVGNGAGLGLVQMLSPVSLHVSFRLCLVLSFPSQSGLC